MTEIKRLAAQFGRSMMAVIDDALRARCHIRKSWQNARRFISRPFLEQDYSPAGTWMIQHHCWR